MSSDVVKRRACSWATTRVDLSCHSLIRAIRVSVLFSLTGKAMIYTMGEMGKLLGEILIDMGVIGPEYIRVALEHQESIKKGRKIGEILVEEGYITKKQLKKALKIQKSGK